MKELSSWILKSSPSCLWGHFIYFWMCVNSSQDKLGVRLESPESHQELQHQKARKVWNTLPTAKEGRGCPGDYRGCVVSGGAHSARKMRDRKSKLRKKGFPTIQMLASKSWKAYSYSTWKILYYRLKILMCSEAGFILRNISPYLSLINEAFCIPSPKANFKVNKLWTEVGTTLALHECEISWGPN